MFVKSTVKSPCSQWGPWIRPFSSPEPVVSWSRGRETRGSGSSRYRMSENFWHPVAHGENFTSSALSREWLLWDVLKMHHFTQLGFTDNLENLKKTVTEAGWTHCWFAELRQLIGRLSSELCEFFFNPFGEQTLGKQYRKDRYNAGKSQSKKVSCSMSCNCYLTSKRFLKRNHSCVVLGE